MKGEHAQKSNKSIKLLVATVGITFLAEKLALTIWHILIQMMVAIVSIPCLFLLSSSHKFIGIWVALTIYMSLRALAGFWR
jgi:hypothetical protein